uniref:PiggyBac transposable element-derived protein domain-containing protein n=1 Tax=Globisporangium ultimum (strain ATCC 200006 / CBS 805.95 / DAOM BR144) TaxID=431595 RepID=K3XBM5_GLOUD
MGKVLVECKESGRRMIAVDRYYTSISLALQLLLIKLYSVRTIMSDGVGYCKDVINKATKHAKGVEPGSFVMVRAVSVPLM